VPKKKRFLGAGGRRPHTGGYAARGYFMPLNPGLRVQGRASSGHARDEWTILLISGMGSDPHRLLISCTFNPQKPPFLTLRMNEHVIDCIYLPDIIEHTLQLIIIKNLPFEGTVNDINLNYSFGSDPHNLLI